MFKKSHLAILLLGALAPLSSYASNYCIAVGGGFGSGGATFVGTGFAVPAAGTCGHWSGFTKAFSSVILTTTGTGCLSSDGKVLNFSLSSADPSFYGSGVVVNDWIRMCPAGTKSCVVGGGTDHGNFGGAAAPVACTSSLLSLPALHD
ncbi:MAG: hypothetical protein JSR66_00395 [Proteobacteria bacterium]|nr:hypothetical protein [Pseudomonadota bacterium]